jgi:hypothetical protein
MRIVVHIGFNKTATTTLQHSVFARQEGWAYAGPKSDGGVMRWLSENLWSSDDADYLEHAAAGYFAHVGRGARALVASHEGFGRHLQGGRTARRLHDLFPGAHVLAVVRDQRSMARSLYYMYLSRGGVLPFETWLRSASARVEHLHFDAAISQYQAEFGSEQVCTLVYEDFVADPAAFVARVVEYITPGERPNVSGWPLPRTNRSLSRAGRSTLRRVNRWFVRGPENESPPVPVLQARGRYVRWLGRLDERLIRRSSDPTESDLPDELVSSLAESNARLAALTGLDLRARGYLLPEVAAARSPR